MKQFPKIETERLVLSKLTSKDIPAIVAYASNKNISKTTQNIPHPYEEKDAIFWVNSANQGFLNKTQFTFAIRLKTYEFIGGIGLRVDNRNQKAEIGYWVAEDFWNKGYATEATGSVIKFAFEELNLNKVFATYLEKNISSKKVMIKCGMKEEAVLKEHIKKEDIFHTLIQYRLTKDEFESLKRVLQ